MTTVGSSKAPDIVRFADRKDRAVPVIAGVGSWWFGIPFWQAVLIGFAYMGVLALIAAFE